MKKSILIGVTTLIAILVFIIYRQSQSIKALRANAAPPSKPQISSENRYSSAYLGM